MSTEWVPGLLSGLRSALLLLALIQAGELTVNAAETAALTTASRSLLLESTDFKSTVAWELKRQVLQQEWEQLLGPQPERVDLNPQIRLTETAVDHDRILLTYETEPGIRTDAYLLIPHTKKGPLPAAIVFHGTSNNHILQPVGLADAPTRNLALYLVWRGYVTLCPRSYIYGSADADQTTVPLTPARTQADFTSQAALMASRTPGRTGMAKMLWDGMRAVDYLLTRSEVDPDRVVAVGHSLGAKETLYLMAFDPRVRAGIASEGGIGLGHSNWNADWYLGAQAANPQFGHDHDELLAMIAPRSFLVAAGESADGKKTTPYIEAARKVHALYGNAESLILSIHGKGHDFPDEAREKAFDWLQKVITP